MRNWTKDWRVGNGNGSVANSCTELHRAVIDHDVSLLVLVGATRTHIRLSASNRSLVQSSTVFGTSPTASRQFVKLLQHFLENRSAPLKRSTENAGPENARPYVLIS